MTGASMTNEECYAIWAPEEAVWSRWARPVLFAQLDTLGLTTDACDLTGLEEARLPNPREGAVIVDLPGAESVRLGLCLARNGFRPVPLFNGTSGPSPIVDVKPIAQNVWSGVDLLRESRIHREAAPAFLLDANRMVGVVSPGKYDNRWVVLPQDFPSGTLLLSRGIREVLLIQRGTTTVKGDLSHILLRWQQAGIRLRVLDLQSAGSAEDLRVSPPPLFRRAWYGVIALLGLRRHNVGGFGGLIPEQTTGGGWA